MSKIKSWILAVVGAIGAVVLAALALVAVWEERRKVKASGATADWLAHDAASRARADGPAKVDSAASKAAKDNAHDHTPLADRLNLLDPDSDRDPTDPG